jgi:ATP-binding cassette subfamily B multidrug efflux pump
MRLRWNFHRLMLEQSMSFYQDEFAGRIATKVMQTSLAVRDTWLIFTDIMVYVVIYFVTLVAVLGAFDIWLVLPFLGWLAAYLATLWYFVPRLGQGGAGAGRCPFADDRARDRRLHQHRHRQAVLARAPRGRFCARTAMQEFMVTAYGQMRLVTASKPSTRCSAWADRGHRDGQPAVVDTTPWAWVPWRRPRPWPFG